MKGKSIVGLILTLIIIASSVYVAIFGIGPDKTGSAEDIKLGLDLAGGVSITYQAIGEDISNTAMDDAVHIIQRRVDRYSTESAVYREGNDRINADIPGVTDANAILEELGKPGALEFKDENDNVLLTGVNVLNATAVSGTNQLGQMEYNVNLRFDEEGSEKFANATRDNYGRQIFIYYDGQVVSEPVVSSIISNGEASIYGMRSFEEANNLAATIRIGALPVELEELRSNIVGAQLGQNAIDSSLLAGLIGLVLVILFMVIVYKISGVSAGLVLIFYAAVMLISINLFDITLTLPGIAGIILSIGMAVDANVIIFSRIKEELGQDKTLRASIKSGFRKATSAIVDGNITTLIASIVLFWMGTGPIKGFASTLALGIVLSMITSLIVTRIVLTLLMKVGFKDKKLYGIQKEVKTYDILKKRKTWFAVSIIVITIGLVALPINKGTMGEILNFDIEFSGGTSTLVSFNEEMTFEELEDQVRPLVADATGDASPQLQSVQGTNQVIIKTRALDVEQRQALDAVLIDEFQVNRNEITSESISPTVSSEMRRDAIIAVALSALFMLIYITIRFRDITFGASAVIALLHDIFIVLAVYSVLRIPINNSFIAAMLTIVGYSINDSIVVFDRIRENKETMKRGDFKGLVNFSISQTLTRSINTSITTFLMIFVLFVVGFTIPALREFALPLIVGILSGTYSSIFIASPLWFLFKKKEQKQ
ncbi:SecD/SecF fusion protein [Natranaerovirga hydrolytica]|uniref:Multifunctional fusion protein n=1 Tax=Natranaerovirga hydrolytica TaxID=680378 RepID=A0A4R1MX69_9FIRM|nr:protein translocase subunit SecD [Natranaerovirga hydrolytica]TCK97796.1 SecD/SecF fusion protein [Natranaerovirga hydrolytica]